MKKTIKVDEQVFRKIGIVKLKEGHKSMNDALRKILKLK